MAEMSKPPGGKSAVSPFQLSSAPVTPLRAVTHAHARSRPHALPATPASRLTLSPTGTTSDSTKPSAAASHARVPAERQCYQFVGILAVHPILEIQPEIAGR